MKHWDFRSRMRRHRPEWRGVHSQPNIDDADLVLVAVIGACFLIALLLGALCYEDGSSSLFGELIAKV
ncbi:hypothetical protein WOC76_01295 [Methylocystis sp. IM3]|uniref:hypothetical protein n=1 Tax=unclassified Methylocystis TaxID=2625913 RepID=UPI0030FC6338